MSRACRDYLLNVLYVCIFPSTFEYFLDIYTIESFREFGIHAIHLCQYLADSTIYHQHHQHHPGCLRSVIGEKFEDMENVEPK
jgi:hypothetical protein